MRTQANIRRAHKWERGASIGGMALTVLIVAAITRLVWPVSRKPSPHVRRRGSWLWAPLVVYAAGVFAAVNYLLPGRTSADLNLYVIQPAMWGLLALASLFALRRAGYSSINARLIFFALLAAAFHVAALASAGMLYGFGYSPYAREPLHMAQNGFYLATMVLGVECCRAYLLSVFYERQPFLAIAALSVLFALLLIPVSNYRLLDSPESGFHAAGETFLPAIAQSALASYLAVRGGFLPAFLYHGGILAYEWFSPILPALEWTVAAFVATTAPIISLLTTRTALAEIECVRAGNRRYDVSAPWVIASMLVVALLWFNTGLLGVKPSVVTGVSMEPTMETGDIVLMREVDSDDLDVGDVIQFQAGATRVFHRITQIEETEMGRVFVTKGDNNNAPDDPIVEDQVEGQIVFTVPRIGWVPLKLDQLLSELN